MGLNFDKAHTHLSSFIPSLIVLLHRYFNPAASGSLCPAAPSKQMHWQL